MKSMTLSFKVSRFEYEKLKEIASKRGVTLSSLMREIVQNYTRFDALENKINAVEELVREVKDKPNKELLKYLQKIYYHSYRSDVGTVEFSRGVKDDNFADELNRRVEDILRK